jgi:hypothetical protein
LVRKEDMSMFLALVLADADIDERCEYPSADEINIKVQELNAMKKSRKNIKEKGRKTSKEK